MKGIFKRMPKSLLALLTGVGVIAGVSMSVNAWWPERPTFTIEEPADFVTFNSITNNPREGDERPFFELKDAANTQPNGFAHKIDVEDGQEVLLRMYVHNNARKELNGNNYDGPGVAHNTKVRVWLPQVKDNVMRANAYISADNAVPQEVSDTADFFDSEGKKFTLEYVPGSAYASNNAVGPRGMQLSDDIVTTGAHIGYHQPDGKVPGCFEFVNIVTLKVKVKMDNPDFTVDKKVTVPGTGSWEENVTVDPEEEVVFQIGFTNKGNTTLEDVVIRDQLPEGMSLVPGTVKLYNSNHPSGIELKTSGDNVVSKNGINIGDYQKTANAIVRFTAKAPELDDLECGKNSLKNIAEARVGNLATTDNAFVHVNKNCQPKPESIVCDALKVDILNNKTREVEAKVMGSAQNTTISGYKIDFGDGTVVNEHTAKHTYGDYGKYTIVAHVTGTVDGKEVTVTSEGCKKHVEFKKPPKPEVQSLSCDALNLDLFNKDKKYVKVSVDATAQNTSIDKYTINFGDGSSPVNEQTAEHTYGDYGTYKIVASVTGMVDGKEVTDSGPNCEQTVEFKKPEQPVAPELPNTGAGALIGLFSGVSLLGAAGHRMWTVRKLQ